MGIEVTTQTVKMIILLKLTFLFAIALAGNPQVSTKLGQVLGQWRTSAGGRTYASFEGVPYAVPPVGQYRFVETLEAKPWEGVWNASKPMSVCLRFSPTLKVTSGQEDCLYLNIYTPVVKSSALLPVILFIHDGAYLFGSGSMYGAERLMDYDVVVVTINYRLGPFGFLSTGDGVVPGNAGLKDQTLAMKWVKHHIQNFGGNPDNVVLYGYSAGSSSIHFHLLSPRSRGLFHRGIMSSGSAFVPWSLQIKPEEKAKRLSGLVGCPSESNEEMVDCLRSRPAQMVLNAQTDMLGWRGDLYTPFQPVIEPPSKNAFVDKNPYESTKKGDFQQVPLLISFTADAGLYIASYYQSDPTILQELEDRFTELAPYTFNYIDTLPKERRGEVASKIKEFYFDNRPISEKTIKELVKALGDRTFYVGIGEFTQLYTLKSKENAYMYQYTYRGEKTVADTTEKTYENFNATHTDDLYRIFKVKNFDLQRKDEIEIIKNLVHIICSFASTGRPALPNSDHKWPPVSPGDVNGINILSPNNFETFKYENFGNKTFWNSLGFYENERAYAEKNH